MEDDLKKDEVVEEQPQNEVKDDNQPTPEADKETALGKEQEPKADEVKEDEAKKEEVKEGKCDDHQPSKKDDGDEQITMTKKEFEQRLKNKFVEGQRKAGANPQSNPDETDYKTLSESLTVELQALKNTLKMDELGVDKAKQEDMFALIKGKGLEINEETIRQEAEKHPEWKAKAVENGIEKLGQSQEDKDQERRRKEAQLAEDRKAFGL